MRGGAFPVAAGRLKEVIATPTVYVLSGTEALPNEGAGCCAPAVPAPARRATTKTPAARRLAGGRADAEPFTKNPKSPRATKPRTGRFPEHPNKPHLDIKHLSRELFRHQYTGLAKNRGYPPNRFFVSSMVSRLLARK